VVFVENFRVALAALRANKMRSILTALGIIIGVAAVIAVVSIVQGLQHMITAELQGVGATYMIVLPDQPQRGPGVVSRQVKLTWQDGQAIQQRVPGVDLITPVVIGRSKVKFRDREHQPDLVLGVNQDWQEVMNHTVDRGRFFSRIDTENRRKVAVIGQELVDQLRLGPDPVGKEIYVGRYPATVIGIMEEKGQTLGEDLDDLIFVPFESAVNLFGRDAGDQIQLRIQAESAEVVDQVEDGIRGVLRQRHNIPEGQPDDFQVLVQDEILEVVNSILGGVTAVVGGIVGIALLVGGIGIMNIMLVSVTERTREIGVRKAVGARRQDVLVQFLIEAVTLSLVGGGIGLGLGFLLGTGAAKLIPNFPDAHVPLWAMLLAFGFSAGVGIFFGIYPAAKASRLDPIDALRYE
jgi:putative ABC transport system permease protein